MPGKYDKFIDACRCGDLEAAQASCPEPDRMDIGYAALRAACEGGPVAFFDETTPRISIRIQPKTVEIVGNNLVCTFDGCSYGMKAEHDGDELDPVETIKWLLTCFPFKEAANPDAIGLGMLRHAGANPSLKIAKWLSTSEYRVHPDQVREYGNYILGPAMELENKENLEWFRCTYRLTFDDNFDYGRRKLLYRTSAMLSQTSPDNIMPPFLDLLGCDDLGFRFNAFRSACELGLESALDMVGPAVPRERYDNEALLLVKLNRHSAFARALNPIFDYSDTIPQTYTGYLSPPIPRESFRAMRYYCATGNLKMAQTIASRYEVAREIVRSHSNSILRLTLTRGHLEVADWLMRAYNLTVDDVRADCGYVVRFIRRRHRMLQAGVVTQGRAHRRAMLHRRGLADPEDAKERDHLRVLTWLVVNFDESFIAVMRTICEGK